jgi:hypothetical protein
MPKYRKIIVTGLVSGLGAAAIAFVIIYVATSLGYYDEGVLMPSTNDPWDNAWPISGGFGCYALVLGPLLIGTRSLLSRKLD